MGGGEVGGEEEGGARVTTEPWMASNEEIKIHTSENLQHFIASHVAN